ncbi:MAG: 2-keto-4-pentenoate hydratase [Microcystaceae cyanobacterium]
MLYYSRILLSRHFAVFSLVSYFLLLFVNLSDKALSKEAIELNQLVLADWGKESDKLKITKHELNRPFKLKPKQPRIDDWTIQQQITYLIDNLIDVLNQAYLNREPIGDIIPDLTLEQGYLIQQKFVETLVPSWGKPIGYKVGLTNTNTQQRLQINHPVRGILLEKMLLKNGAVIQSDWGAVPRLEGDLMVRIGSDEINQVKTRKEAIQYIDAVIPFVELPDLMFERDVKLTGTKLIAVNVGARLGVMGKPVLLENKKEWQTQLSQIKVTIKDSKGKELGTGSSDSLLNDPLNVVLWLKDELKSQDKTLQKGDLISLGSMTPLLSIPSEGTVTAIYEGLEKDKKTILTITFDN